MTSKELNKILNQTRRTLDISLTAEQVEELIKDLEILEILKNHYRFNQNINEGLLVLKKPVLNEDAEKIKEWLGK